MNSDFLSKCQQWWTPERLNKLTAGKKLVLTPLDAPELLRVMGLLNPDASMSADNVSKFLQINHMLHLLMPTLEDLRSRFTVVRVFDACCGNSFLTLLLGWLFAHRWNKSCEIIGVDLNAKVIHQSQERAKKLGLENVLKFKVAPVGNETWVEAYGDLFHPATGADVPRPHLVVALHACDTATDYALAAAIHTKADAIAVAPCCQAELAKIWKDVKITDHPFRPIFETPNLRREIAAQVTDTMRLLLCRSRGYEVTATEFIPASHTPKNRLLLCIRRGNYLKGASMEFERLKQSLASTTIQLESLLAEEGRA